MIYDQLQALPDDSEPWIVDHTPIAVEVSDTQLRTRAVADSAARTATLFANGGLRAGTYCVVWLEAPVDILIACAAISATGATPIMISPAMTSSILAATLHDVPGIVAIVAADQRFAECAVVVPDAKHYDWRAVIEEAAGQPPLSKAVERSLDEPYIVTHTSGTTGVPKLVEYTARSIDFDSKVQALLHWGARLRGYCGVGVSPVHGRSVVGISAALRRKAPLLFLQNSTTEEVERALKRYRPMYLEAHPYNFRAWQHLGATGAFKSVRFYATSFDVIHPDTVKALLDGSKYRLALYAEVYGQSESGAIASRLHLKGLRALRRRHRSKALPGHPVGSPVPYCKVRILDEDGNKVSRGTPGRIVVRTPVHISRYLNRKDIAARQYPADGWWDTGDIGIRSKLGFLTLIDRQVDRLSLAPSGIAIEDMLLDKFPEFLELVILEVDGRLIPILSLRDGERLDTVKWADATREVEHLDPPVVIPDAQFPRTITGKIRRIELREKARHGEIPVSA